MHSDVTLEMAWTVIPALILVAITVPTVHTIIRTQPDKLAGGNARGQGHRASMVVGIQISDARAWKLPTNSTFRADRPIHLEMSRTT